MKKKENGSMTVEASICLPVFLFAMILIGYLGQMIRCQDEVQSALSRVAKEAAAEYGMSNSTPPVIFCQVKFQSKSNTIKSQAYYLAKMSLYLEGSAGKITFFQSRLLKENDEIDLIAGFRVKTPFSIFSLGSCQFRQRVHTRAFTGVERREKENEKDCVVYLTETGTVYHRSLDCSYLKLTISKVLYRDLVNLRNSSGGKYKICERCCHGITPQDGEEVYITIYGDRYHKSRTCSGLKRTIREIMLSQVGNRAPCSKCGGKEK